MRDKLVSQSLQNCSSPTVLVLAEARTGQKAWLDRQVQEGESLVGVGQLLVELLSPPIKPRVWEIPGH